MANGASLAGGPVGMMVIPPTMEYLLSVYGWNAALGLLASLSTNLVVCGAVLRHCKTMRGRYQPLDGQNDSQTETTTARNSPEKGKEGALQVLRKFFNVELITQPIFIVYQVLILCVGLIYSMWHLFLIPLGVQLGHGETLSAFLATFGGLGTLAGRLGHGYPIDRKLTQSTSVFLGALLLLAASSLLNPLVKTSFIGLATLAVISGVPIGVIFPLTYLLMEEDFDMSDTALGWLFCSLGTGMVVGGFSAGWIHDVSDDYNIVFVAIGVLSIVMAFILSLTRCFAGPKDK
ncbi:monocarboxylate transporter 12-B-like [Asterias rubens]|uniref:monocarboxylate transporter 12-B-like n=1 Tax=Asterias rubens TaxID=7604 RepID=UPI0014550DBA|nr:monocarboxylate transporter 12-B-like [Asterias rubens]